jgi:hypothetical protein
MIAKTIRRLFSTSQNDTPRRSIIRLNDIPRNDTVSTAGEQRVKLKEARIRLEAEKKLRAEKKRQAEAELVGRLFRAFAKSMDKAVDLGHGEMNVLLDQEFSLDVMLAFVKELESRGYSVSSCEVDRELPAVGFLITQVTRPWFEKNSIITRYAEKGPTTNDKHYEYSEYCNYVVSL